MKYLRVLFVIVAFLFVGCGGYKKSINKEECSKPPTIEILNSLKNCDNDLCSKELVTEGLSEDLQEVDNKFVFNWIMNADIEAFFTRDDNLIPKLEFHLLGIDDDAVKKVTYKYQKKDNTGKIIYEGSEQELVKLNDVYTIKYNTEMLAPVIANSYPEEEQNIIISIIDLNNVKYSQTVIFKIKALEIKAVNITRNPDILNADYYTSFVPDSDGVFLLDDLVITNTQDRSFVLNGEIILDNTTNALVAVKNKEQHIVNLGKPNEYYPRNLYQWTVQDESYTSYSKVVSEGSYILKVLRGDVLEDVSFLVNDDGRLNINNLLIHKNEQLDLLVFSKVNVNSELLGTHGSKKFYTGISFYNSFEDPIMCSLFYTYAPYAGSGGSLGRNRYYLGVNAIIEILSQQIYPDCTIDANQTLREEYFPENTINLVGRKHIFNEQFNFSVKEQGYDGDPFQNINKTLETLDGEEGSYDEGLINNDYIYSGYIL